MELTQDEVLKMFDYQEDGHLVRRLSTSGNGNYAGRVIGTKPDGTRSKRYSQTKLRGQNVSVHKVIYLYHHGIMPEQVDHINGNSSDNRIENLRIANAAQNAQNRSLFSNNKSGCKGVIWHKAIKKWQSYVSFNKQMKHLGYFVDKELAELVAVEARNLYHGDFAKHA